VLRRIACAQFLLAACLLAPASAHAADVTNGRIAFASGRTGDLEIYTMKADGTDLVRVTNQPGRDEFPVWSPDGEKIAFASSRDGNVEAYTMNADGTEVTRLTNAPGNDVPGSWSRDGSRIAFSSERSGNFDVWTMDPDGTDLIQVTNAPGTDSSASFSPDRSRIVYSSRSFAPNSDIYVVNADGSGRTQLTTDAATDQVPAWSPDGAKIAFESVRNGTFQIFTMNPDGSAQTRITSGSDQGPEWSSDSSRIVFARSFTGIFAVTADGTSTEQLTFTGADFQPSWGIGLADVTLPVITVPSTLTREAGSAAGAAVVYTVTAADDVDGPVPVTCTPPSGSTFALGTTTVSCSATDAAGNTATASFGVVLVDTSPPTLTAPVSVSVDATSAAGAAVTLDAVATDTVDPAPEVVCTPPSGSVLAIGTHTVTCFASDDAGNTSTSLSITVVVKGSVAQIADLAAEIRAINLKQGLANSLDAKLQNVLDALAKAKEGSTAPACNQLAALAAEIDAQAGKEITEAQAASLREDVARIRIVLAC
jgi:dipeptidyl aminopeptidase/acylaminoacyl peptidase